MSGPPSEEELWSSYKQMLARESGKSQCAQREPKFLTLEQIGRIAYDVEHGTAKPDDVRHLLADFCAYTKAGHRCPPPQLLDYLSSAFQRYLDGSCTLEAALGLKRKRGHPKADEQDRIQMAAEILRQRLAGKSHQSALRKIGYATSVLGEAWRDYRLEAIAVVENERRKQGCGSWSEQEKRLLKSVLKDQAKVDANAGPRKARIILPEEHSGKIER